MLLVPRRFVMERDRDQCIWFSVMDLKGMKNNLIADPSSVVLDMMAKTMYQKHRLILEITVNR